MEKTTFCVAAAAAEHLGGADAIGRQVLSDADMAMAVGMGFTVETIDAPRKGGVSRVGLSDKPNRYPPSRSTPQSTPACPG